MAGRWSKRRVAAAAIGVAAAVYCLDGAVRKGWLEGKPRVLFKDEDERIKRILTRMESLKGRYAPTFWAHGPFAQLGLMLFWRAWHARQATFKQRILACEDGGEVALEEYVPDRRDAEIELQPDAPVMLVLHTITGRASDEVEFCRMAVQRGFRPIVLSRRGHFGRLQTPKFNLMGCTRDTKLMVDAVKEQYPNSFIGAVGVSAGSGQVVSYIGRQNGPGPVQAAVSLCPAYDVRTAFANFDSASPRLAAYLLDGLKRFFLYRNRVVLSQHKGYEECLATTSIQEFFERAVHMAGHATFDEYLDDSNPMAHYHLNEVPCLVLNATDDPLCVEDNIRYDIASQTENYSLVLTTSGSHVAYREGLLGEGCYMHRVALDFLESAMLDAHKPSSA